MATTESWSSSDTASSQAPGVLTPMTFTYQHTTSTVRPDTTHSLTLPWRLMLCGSCGEGLGGGSRSGSGVRTQGDWEKATPSHRMTVSYNHAVGSNEGGCTFFFVEGCVVDHRQAPGDEGVGRVRLAVVEDDVAHMQLLAEWGLRGPNQTHGSVPAICKGVCGKLSEGVGNQEGCHQ